MTPRSQYKFQKHAYIGNYHKSHEMWYPDNKNKSINLYFTIVPPTKRSQLGFKSTVTIPATRIAKTSYVWYTLTQPVEQQIRRPDQADSFSGSVRLYHWSVAGETSCHTHRSCTDAVGQHRTGGCSSGYLAVSNWSFSSCNTGWQRALHEVPYLATDNMGWEVGRWRCQSERSQCR